MANKKLVLPREDKDGNFYLSYSQITTWRRSKRDYIRQYFFGEGFDGNAYTDFGTKVGEALENNNFSEFSKKEQKFLETVPRYDEFEREIKLLLEGFYIKGYIDSNTVEGSGESLLIEKVLDYKTGEVGKKEAEYESDDYHQLHIYSAAVLQDTGKLPKEVGVVLIDRQGNAFKGEKLTLGDKFKYIKKDVTKESVDKVIQEIYKTAYEINKYYEVFLNLKK